MSTPDFVPAEDAAEQQLSAAGDDAHSESPEAGLDAPEADVAEQAQRVGPAEHRADRELPLEADPADAAEQAVVVPHDDEDGRD